MLLAALARAWDVLRMGRPIGERLIIDTSWSGVDARHGVDATGAIHRSVYSGWHGETIVKRAPWRLDRSGRLVMLDVWGPPRLVPLPHAPGWLTAEKPVRVHRAAAWRPLLTLDELRESVELHEAGRMPAPPFGKYAERILEAWQHEHRHAQQYVEGHRFLMERYEQLVKDHTALQDTLRTVRIEWANEWRAAIDARSERDALMDALREFVHEYQSGDLTQGERIAKARCAIMYVTGS